MNVVDNHKKEEEMNTFKKVREAYKNYLKRPKEEIDKEHIEFMTVELEPQYYALFKKVYTLFDVKFMKVSNNKVYYVVTSNTNSLLALELYDYLKKGIEKEVKEEYSYIKALSESERLAQYGLLIVSKEYAIALYLENFLKKVNRLYEQTLFDAKEKEGNAFDLQHYMLPKAIREYEIGGKEDGE